MGARLMAIVAEGERGRVYLAPTPEHEAGCAQGEAGVEAGDRMLPSMHAASRVADYGLTTWGDLFTPRQLVALTTFSDLVQEARERVHARRARRWLPDDVKPLRDGGAGATAYAEAVAVYLAFALSKQADLGISLCTLGCQSRRCRTARIRTPSDSDDLGFCRRQPTCR